MSSKFDNMSLKDILTLAKIKDEAANRYLIKRYQSMIITVINKGYFLTNGDRDDLFAEGLIGLTRAIQDFDEDKSNGSNFQKKLESFFYMCIHRSIISAIKTSNRYKNKPLNNTSSLDRPLKDNDNLTAMDVIASKQEVRDTLGNEFFTPEEALILEESVKNNQENLYKLLSDVEKEIYELRHQKYSYKEIKEKIGCSKTKSVDNALQRIRSKLNSVVNQEMQKSINGLEE